MLHGFFLILIEYVFNELTNFTNISLLNNYFYQLLIFDRFLKKVYPERLHHLKKLMINQNVNQLKKDCKFTKLIII